MDNANSLASYLESLGYSTLATHPADGDNYGRAKAFPALGFDRIHFIEDYSDLEYYYTDPYPTDSSVYKNVIKWYEAMGDSPRFVNLVTIQNHAPYASVADNIVKTDAKTTEDNEYPSSIDMYESLMYLTDTALGELFEYFRTVDRDVVVCMYGDHCPYLVYYYTDETMFSDWFRKNLAHLETPYIIWSNNDDLLGEGPESDVISMNYLVPTLLESAGVELSGYYDYLVNLRDKYPVIFTDGTYLRNGREMEANDDIKRYLRIGYLNMTKPLECVDFFRKPAE